MNYRAIKDATVAAYLTAFVIACAVTVGFIIGVIVSNGMAVQAIAKLNHATNAAILERSK